ncbi:hypothetical protein OGAPHI_001430 [Ogataea philodendri]|uniref:ubiquitinyl hydrolase 1 n=1 Tax=Ogataea philodendri TaxID=1378263 RepID=A0A9P8PD77_9ASCO|nr:uncharacterized protein OGAPHI_001430 [Ogataea philodendri]KAH3669309.1 hypothetical protein OGAPHI_001430 [Ogataea philodendri]
MKPPPNYSGVLLQDHRDHKKFPIKLSNDQKALLKAVTPSVVQHSRTRSLNKDAQRLISSLIVLLDLTSNNTSTVAKLFRYYRYWQLSCQGRLITTRGQYKFHGGEQTSDIHLIGMDNWKNVLCYMDSLLVSMFYSTDSFDFLLDGHQDDSLSSELQQDIKDLKEMLRFIVNLLRGGEHIPINIMKQLCFSLNGLGCDMVVSQTQQDALQLFEFLAECLSLPLLTMKLDIIHSGKLNVNDDMRIIEERALLISVPEDTTPHAEDEHGAPISLEECLNMYFNNSITVRRHLERRRTLDRDDTIDDHTRSEISKDIPLYERLGIVTSNDDQQDSSLHDSPSSSVDLSTALSNSTVIGSESTGDRTATAGSILKLSERMEASRTRSSTIASVLNNAVAPNSTRLTRRASSVSNNEVTLPAWMFLQLLPYYTNPKVKLRLQAPEKLYKRISRSVTHDTVDSSEVAPQISEFEERFHSKRPTIPICLKKYIWDEDGQSQKINRKVVIPEVIKYPYFIAEDSSRPGIVDFKRSTDNQAPFGSFMLVLESCICHRGKSVSSGHYVSLVRKHPFNPRESQPSESKNWLLFNDILEEKEKAKPISFQEAMEQEDPYILFYQIVELDQEVESDYTANATSGDESTIRPPKGARDKYWASDSESSMPNSTVLAARKSSVVSQVSYLSLKSAANNRLPITVDPPSEEIVPPPSASAANIASRSSSKNRKHTDSEVLPTEAAYLDIESQYYWYDTSAEGTFKKPHNYHEKPALWNPQEENQEGGLIDRINSRLLTLKRGPVSNHSNSAAPSVLSSNASVTVADSTDTENEEKEKEKLPMSPPALRKESVKTPSPSLRPKDHVTPPTQDLVSPQLSKVSLSTSSSTKPAKPDKKKHGFKRLIKKMIA